MDLRRVCHGTSLLFHIEIKVLQCIAGGDFPLYVLKDKGKVSELTAEQPFLSVCSCQNVSLWFWHAFRRKIGALTHLINDKI